MMTATEPKSLRYLNRGDKVIVESGSHRHVAVAGRKTLTEIRCSRRRFKLATGKEVGGSSVLRLPREGELDELAAAAQAKQEEEERRIEEEVRQLEARQSTPHYRLAKEISRMDSSGWDLPDMWVQHFTMAQLQTIKSWIDESRTKGQRKKAGKPA